MAEPATVIRPVRPEEQAHLGELTVRTYQRLLHLEEGGYADVLRDVGARTDTCEVLVAVSDDRVVGGVTYVPGPGPYSALAGDHEAEIRMLVVDPHAQGRGVGEALVRSCIERATGQGKQALSLYTTGAMSDARRLYARMGFVRVPERDSSVGDGLRLLCYTLELGGPLSSG